MNFNKFLHNVQGVEFLQEHSSVMGSVTLAAAVTMVRTMGRGGSQTMGLKNALYGDYKQWHISVLITHVDTNASSLKPSMYHFMIVTFLCTLIFIFRWAKTVLSITQLQ